MANGNGNKMYRKTSKDAQQSFGSKPGAGKGDTGQRSANDIYKVSPGAAVPSKPSKGIDPNAPGSANRVFTSKPTVPGPTPAGK